MPTRGGRAGSALNASAAALRLHVAVGRRCGQVHEADPRRRRRRHRDRETGLADSGRSDEGHQATGVEVRGDRRELGDLPTNDVLHTWKRGR